MANTLNADGLRLDSGKTVRVGYSEDDSGVKIYGDGESSEEYGTIAIYGKSNDASDYNYDRRYIKLDTSSDAKLTLYHAGKYTNHIEMSADTGGYTPTFKIVSGSIGGNNGRRIESDGIELAAYNAASNGNKVAYISASNGEGVIYSKNKIQSINYIIAGASNDATQGQLQMYVPSTTHYWTQKATSSGLEFSYT